MKKIRSAGVIALTAALLLSAAMTSCRAEKNQDEDRTGETEQEKLPIKPYKDFAENEPYRITYTTEEGVEGCVAVIEYHPYYEDEFVLEIPDQSPDGVAVTKVSSNSLYDVLPHYLLEEDFRKIQKAAEKYFGVTYEEASEYRFQKNHPLAEQSFYLCKFMSYFIEKSRDGVNNWDFASEEERQRALQELSKSFPITDTGVAVYVLDHVATNREKITFIVRTLIEIEPQLFDGLGYEGLVKIKELCEEHSIDDPYATELLKNYSGRGKGVTDIVWPSSLREIDEMTFLGCESLTRVTIPGTVQSNKITQEYEGREMIVEWTGGVGEYAFSYCSHLKEVTFSEGINFVGYGVLHGNMKLKSIRLPQTLERIGGEICTVNPFHDSQFDGSSLPSIHFGGTRAQWDRVNIRTDINGFDQVSYEGNAYFTVHCTDGVIEAIEYTE